MGEGKGMDIQAFPCEVGGLGGVPEARLSVQTCTGAGLRGRSVRISTSPTSEVEGGLHAF